MGNGGDALLQKIVAAAPPECDADAQEVAETMERTRLGIGNYLSTTRGRSRSPTLFRYKSSSSGRLIKLNETSADPLAPPKFKYKRVPRAPAGSPPAPLMRSPPWPVSSKDQQCWKVPPCVSDWKNPGGDTIPLDKRQAADGRRLQQVQINDDFAALSESLYAAEHKAREAVQLRSKVQKELILKDREKEQELQALADMARQELAGLSVSATSARVERDEVRELGKIVETHRFKPERAFSGASMKVARPVEFDEQENDPFGLDQFLVQLKTGAAKKLKP